MSTVPRLISPFRSVGVLAAAALLTLGGGSTASAQTTPGCVPVGAIQVVVQNLRPGQSLTPGSPITVSGFAYDPTAPQGTGIDKVTVFLDSRDQGGLSLGSATLGLPSPGVGSGGQFAHAGFSLQTPALPTRTGAHTLFVYAHSTVTNMEGVLQVPVYLGDVPTPLPNQTATPIPPTPAACTPVPTATASPTTTPAPPPPATPTGTPIVLASPTPPPSTSTPSAAAAAPAATRTPAVAAGTTAPRGGGIPPELGLPLLGAGALLLAGAAGLRRREQRRRRGRDGTPAD